MNKNQKMCVMVAIFSGVMLFISGTNFSSTTANSTLPAHQLSGGWFSGMKESRIPNPAYDRNKVSSGWHNSPTIPHYESVTNYIAIFCAGLLAVSGAGYFILGNEENKS
jgi:hypothetical protein|tara:strand:- start:693 stop:1019 length:327 start_codon:yes stop_codon:yes gene_type:complete